MALPGSGTITLANVQTEFGGSNPIAITEYYGADTGVPGSGTIALSDFYGKSSAPPTPDPWVSSQWTGRTVTARTTLLIVTNARAWIQVYGDGYYRVYKNDGATSYSQYKWHLNAPGSFSNYSVSYYNSSGSTVNYTNLSHLVYASLSTSRYAGMTTTGRPSSRSGNVSIRIRHSSGQEIETRLHTLSAEVV